MDFALIIVLEALYAIAVLVLISSGLAIVFGMMRVINLAHGEFIILGGYTAITAVSAGANIYVATLVIAPVTVGIFGLILERLIIRHLYGRLINTMLATWGVSLAMIGALTMIFGNVTTGISAPIDSYAIGAFQLSGYNLFVILIAVLIICVLWAVLKLTNLGLIARGTMQDPAMAAAFGLNTNRVYMVTFTAGAMLAGLAGGVLAPLTGISPGSGANFIAKAFITVITGGASVVSGLLVSAGVLGAVTQFLSFIATPVIGEIGLFAAAIILLVILPSGISGRFFRNSL